MKAFQEGVVVYSFLAGICIYQYIQWSPQSHRQWSVVYIYYCSCIINLLITLNMWIELMLFLWSTQNRQLILFFFFLLIVCIDKDWHVLRVYSTTLWYVENDLLNNVRLISDVSPLLKVGGIQWSNQYLRFHLLYFVGALSWLNQFIGVKWLSFQMSYVSVLNAKYPG